MVEGRWSGGGRLRCDGWRVARDGIAPVGKVSGAGAGTRRVGDRRSDESGNQDESSQIKAAKA